MIVCLRTVAVPPEWRDRYLAWIDAGRTIRQQHGILVPGAEPGPCRRAPAAAAPSAGPDAYRV